MGDTRAGARKTTSEATPSRVVINTVCKSLQEVWHKVDTFVASGVECWVEDGDGNPIADNILENATPADDRRRSA